MNQIRRRTLKAGGGAGLVALLASVGMLRTGAALADERAAFEVKTTRDALSALGASNAANSTDILIRAADIAENGAVVPVGVESKIPGTQSISILIDKNPNALAASFDIPAGTDPAVSTRVKLGQTSDVYALVKADGKYYVAKKEIKVTIGGCGG